MAVTPESVIYPRGRIHPDLFPERPGDLLVEDVQAWMSEARALSRVEAIESESDQDAAVRAYVYWRAFDAVSIALAANPSSSTESDAGSSSYAKDQRDRIASFASNALAEFETLAPIPTSELPRGGSRTVEHSFAW